MPTVQLAIARHEQGIRKIRLSLIRSRFADQRIYA
jgi:hypothetical protein